MNRSCIRKIKEDRSSHNYVFMNVLTMTNSFNIWSKFHNLKEKFTSIKQKTMRSYRCCLSSIFSQTCNHFFDHNKKKRKENKTICLTLYWNMYKAYVTFFFYLRNVLAICSGSQSKANNNSKRKLCLFFLYQLVHLYQIT